MPCSLLQIGRFLVRQFILLVLLSQLSVSFVYSDDLSEDDWQLIRQLESHRISAIDAVVGSVIAIYDESKEGGGSGVIIDRHGIALTNHHVIMGAGISGWGGLADGKLYHWKLIGTDPGGDVAIIQMEGRDDFPATPLGNSDQVRVGDWALAMGNPFLLTEDQTPTVTLGIVSGIKRYQPGAGANQLVYGNCIQVDSSINPGNSGGPLFNFQHRVIGINGRGSFQDRGRVNVGLGYAISSNQIKNFIPDLLATKLVEHGTLDASFSDRDGKVLCSTINQDAPVAKAGLKLGDELLEFEGQPIVNANQFTNLICTLPEDWPAVLRVRRADGAESIIHVRLFGLPYQSPPQPKKPPKRRPGDEPPSHDEEKQLQRQQEMVDLLSAPPGEIRYADINRFYANQILTDWQHQHAKNKEANPAPAIIKLTDELRRGDEAVGMQVILIATDGRFRIAWSLDENSRTYLFDGQKFMMEDDEKEWTELSLVEAKLILPVAQALAMGATERPEFLNLLGKPQIDGGDKALLQNAYRLRWLDAEDDKFFVWLSMYGKNGLPDHRILKVSAEKDADGSGGVTLSDWQTVGPMGIPLRREFINGIAETPTLTIVNQQYELVSDPDFSVFEMSPITECACRKE